ncbi:hypothetical protein D3C72_2105430 [compost metagenome]
MFDAIPNEVIPDFSSLCCDINIIAINFRLYALAGHANNVALERFGEKDIATGTKNKKVLLKNVIFKNFGQCFIVIHFD